jgi:hypothetical protein
VRRGNVIAFGLHHPDLGREYVVVAAEVRAGEGAAVDAANESSAGRSRRRTLEALALKIDEVVLLPPGSLPRRRAASSSAARRRRCTPAASSARASARPASSALLKHLAASRWNFIKASLGGRESE